MNRNGNPESLVPQDGNLHAVKSGVYSDRVLSDRIEERRAQLRALPWMREVDEIAIGEASRLLARIEAVDADLDERGHFGRNGARSLLEHRARLTRELRAWLKDLGALPSERASWASKLGNGLTFSERVERRMRGEAS